MTTSRNELCPCGSGKKFKDCCLNKIMRIPQFNWQECPEQYVLGNLLRNSKEFYSFYQNERQKIKQLIHWVEDLRLPKGVDYRFSILKNGDRYIRLRQVPVLKTNGASIAHELQHAIDDALYPSIIIKDQRFEDLSASLDSMIKDLIVNSKIKEYRFNIRSNFEDECREDKKQLKKMPTAPSDHHSRMHWIFNYSSKLLDWELVKSGNEVNDFLVWFDSRYPEISKKAREVVELVKQYDIYNPDKLYNLYAEIIKRYDLSDFLEVIR